MFISANIKDKIMNYNNTQTVLIAYIISNIAGLLFLWVAIKNTKVARLLFVVLFGWACVVNYTGAHKNPLVYLDYSKTAVGFYRSFINGWFSEHITTIVTVIAICQGLVAIGMLLKGIWVKFACIGGILFLVGIAPIGYYAAFPFSVTVALALFVIYRRDDKRYLWHFTKRQRDYSYF
jgi:hypothetical protein